MSDNDKKTPVVRQWKEGEIAFRSGMIPGHALSRGITDTMVGTFLLYASYFTLDEILARALIEAKILGQLKQSGAEGLAVIENIMGLPEEAIQVIRPMATAVVGWRLGAYARRIVTGIYAGKSNGEPLRQAAIETYEPGDVAYRTRATAGWALKQGVTDTMIGAFLLYGTPYLVSGLLRGGNIRGDIRSMLKGSGAETVSIISNASGLPVEIVETLGILLGGAVAWRVGRTGRQIVTNVFTGKTSMQTFRHAVRKLEQSPD